MAPDGEDQRRMWEHFAVERLAVELTAKEHTSRSRGFPPGDKRGGINQDMLRQVGHRQFTAQAAAQMFQKLPRERLAFAEDGRTSFQVPFGGVDGGQADTLLAAVQQDRVNEIERGRFAVFGFEVHG
jgi:hypothetical protein